MNSYLFRLRCTLEVTHIDVFQDLAPRALHSSFLLLLWCRNDDRFVVRRRVVHFADLEVPVRRRVKCTLFFRIVYQRGEIVSDAGVIDTT
jgi:hypothetical protein